MGRSPFEGSQLDAASARQCEALVDSVLHDSINEYLDYTNRHHRVVDPTQWKLLKNREGISVYRQIAPPLALSSSSESSPAPPATRARSRTRSAFSMSSGPDPLRTGRSDAQYWGVPKLLTVGMVAGTVEDAVYGVYAATAEEMEINSFYLHDEMTNWHVLQDLQKPTAADPFYYRGLKYAMAVNPTRGTLTRERDATVAFATGIHELPQGDRIGYLVLHSIAAPQFPVLEDHGIVRAREATCYLYHQRSDRCVEVYSWGYFDAGGHMMDALSLRFSATAHISAWKMSWCGQNKKLVFLLREAAVARHAFRGTRGDGLPSDVASKNTDHCLLCDKRVTMLRRRRVRCDLCRFYVCSRCITTRELMMRSPDGELINAPASFCTSCLTMALARDTRAIVKQLHVYEDTAAARDTRPERTPSRRPVRTMSSLSSMAETEPCSSVSQSWTQDEDIHVVESSDDWVAAQPLARSLSTPSTGVPPRLGSSAPSLEELPPKSHAYQRELWLQMNQLRIVAERTYMIARENSHAMWQK